MSDDSRLVASLEYVLDDVHPEEVMVVDFLRRLNINPDNIEQYSLSFVPAQDNNGEFQFVLIECLQNEDIEKLGSEFSEVDTNLSSANAEISTSLQQALWEQKIIK